MGVSIAPLRILLGLLCAFFSFFLGRSLAARLHGWVKNSQLMRWVLRVAVTAIGAGWGGFDRIAFGSFGLAVLAAGLGFYSLWRPQPQPEDLARKMFPDE